MSTKSRKKVGFSDDVQDKSQRESRSRSRSRFKDRRARSQDVRSTTKKEPIPKKRERSLVALVRTGSQKSVRNLVKLFETRTISTVSYINVSRKLNVTWSNMVLRSSCQGWYIFMKYISAFFLALRVSQPFLR